MGCEHPINPSKLIQVYLSATKLLIPATSCVAFFQSFHETTKISVASKKKRSFHLKTVVSLFATGAVVDPEL